MAMFHRGCRGPGKGAGGMIQLEAVTRGTASPAHFPKGSHWLSAPPTESVPSGAGGRSTQAPACGD